MEHLENVIYEFCADYAKRPSRGYRMIIYGENGSGKSHSARAVFTWAKRIALKIPLVIGTEGECSLADCQCYNWPAVVDGFKNGHWDVIEDMFGCSMLILDDLGAEHDPSKIGVEKLYLVLERREHKWTILTTNVSPENWEQKFERRIASRFFRNAVHVDLSDVPDFNT